MVVEGKSKLALKMLQPCPLTEIQQTRDCGVLSVADLRAAFLDLYFTTAARDLDLGVASSSYRSSCCCSLRKMSGFSFDRMRGCSYSI